MHEMFQLASRHKYGVRLVGDPPTRSRRRSWGPRQAARGPRTSARQTSPSLALVRRFAVIYTRECLLGFIFDTTRGTPTHERERDHLKLNATNPIGSRCPAWSIENLIPAPHDVYSSTTFKNITIGPTKGILKFFFNIQNFIIHRNGPGTSCATFCGDK